MEIRIERTYLNNVTFGDWWHDNAIMCKTMELPWKENRRNESCIPEGIYQVIKCAPTDSRPYEYLRLLNVPNRSGILVHRITYVKDLRGCIGVGKILLPNGNHPASKMIRSGEALTELVTVLPETFSLRIIRKPIGNL